MLGYLAGHLKDARAKELCIPSFISVLFGITEPALFGVNLRYRYPLIGGCIGGAVGGVIVYMTNLAALGFGTTVVPGIALADPAHNGYLNYVIAHVAAVVSGFLFAFLLGIVFRRKAAVEEGNAVSAAIPAAQPAAKEPEPVLQTEEGGAEEIAAFVKGDYIGIEKVNDLTFAQKILGEGVAILPSDNKIYAPADAVVEMVADTKHAVTLRTKAGNGILLHVGIDTVQLGGKYFSVHVETGQEVKKGDCIMDVDFAGVKKEGYDTAVCMIFAELADGRNVTREPEKAVEPGERIALLGR